MQITTPDQVSSPAPARVRLPETDHASQSSPGGHLVYFRTRNSDTSWGPRKQRLSSRSRNDRSRRKGTPATSQCSSFSTEFPPQFSRLPIPFNITDSLHAENGAIGGSFWVNAWVHGSNGKDYYLSAHVMDYASDIPGAKPVYKGAMLGITDPALYVQVGPTIDADVDFYDEDGNFHALFDDFGMETTSDDDPLQGIRAYSEINGMEFDFTFEHSFPALLNAALGSYLVNNGTGYEWSVPRGATSGWFRIDGEKIDIVPAKSSTWYDRQWGSLQSSFSWVAVNFPDPVPEWVGFSTLAVWDWTDSVYGPKTFATVRHAKTGYDSVIAVEVAVSTEKTYTSPLTGKVYPSEGTVQIGDVELRVTTPRPDQIFEAEEEGTGFPPQFSGYVDVEARKEGEESVWGYGAVDLMEI